jgi:bifunctional N-acetylglucosamine-1-phosphate-uridyltransferase/glucosamine-1-phosphate-acetyltransferase GlmU-like protein
MNLFQQAIEEIRSLTPIPDLCSLKEILDHMCLKSGNSNETQGYSILVGPLFFGKNVFVGPFNLIRGPSFIGDNVVIGAHNEVARAVIMSHTNICHNNLILDSIIGKNCNISAGLVVCNRNLDGSEAMGATIGNNTRIGVNVSLMPGCTVADGTFVLGPAIVNKYGTIKSLVK